MTSCDPTCSRILVFPVYGPNNLSYRFPIINESGFELGHQLEFPLFCLPFKHSRFSLLEPWTRFTPGIRGGQNQCLSLESREKRWQRLRCLGGKGNIHCRSLWNPTMCSQDDGKAGKSQQRWSWHTIYILEEGSVSSFLRSPHQWAWRGVGETSSWLPSAASYSW